MRLVKRAYGLPEDETFHAPEEARRELGRALERGAEWEADWRRRLDSYRAAHPELAAELERSWAGELAEAWQAALPTFTPSNGEMATRDVGGKVIAALAAVVPNLIGGSADKGFVMPPAPPRDWCGWVTSGDIATGESRTGRRPRIQAPPRSEQVSRTAAPGWSAARRQAPAHRDGRRSAPYS